MPALKTHPIPVKMLLTGVTYAVGDFFAQLIEKRSDKDYQGYNWKRTAILFGFGTMISGPIYHYWFGYVDYFAATFLKKDATIAQRVATKIALDQAVFSTIYTALFFVGVGTMKSMAGLSVGSPHHGGAEKTITDNAPRTLGGHVQKAWEHTREVYWVTLLADYCVWPAIQWVNFSIIPLQHRTAFVGVGNMFWNTFLCWMANRPKKASTDANKS